MSATAERLMTLEEHLALDEEESKHTEFVDGRLVGVTPPHGRHQRMARRLLLALAAAAPPGYGVTFAWGWLMRPGLRLGNGQALGLRSAAQLP